MKNVVNNIRSRVKGPASRFEMTLLGGGDKAAQADDGANGESPSQVQVEPKTYFANERTFIQWISASLLLLTVSSIMMGSGNYNGTSSVIAFSSLVLVLYAAHVYFRRVQLLTTGQPYGYLDFVGPTILAVGVALGVGIVFADAVKGSEFLPFGSESSGNGNNRDDDRRLTASSPFDDELQQHHHHQYHSGNQQALLRQVQGTCTRHDMKGINLLEYQPRDILLQTDSSSLWVATPQALVAHSLDPQDTTAALKSTISSRLFDKEIQSMTMVGNALWVLSTGPTHTELLRVNEDATTTSLWMQDSPSTHGSMVFVPSDHDSKQGEQPGKLYMDLDGAMHIYQFDHEHPMTPSSLSRTGTINTKVLHQHRHQLGDPERRHPVLAMEHFEGLTYMLRRASIQAWELSTGTLVAEMSLPAPAHHSSDDDAWVGMALERRMVDTPTGTATTPDDGAPSPLRKSRRTGTRTHHMADDASSGSGSSSVFLHMPLDTFPPQIWSFRLEELDPEHKILGFPACE